MVLDSCLLVGGFDELVDQLGGQGVPDPVAGLGGGGAQCDEQVGLAGAGVADQAQRLSLAVTQVLVARVWTTAGSMLGLASKSKSSSDFWRGKPGGLDPAFGAAAARGPRIRQAIFRRGTRGKSSAHARRARRVGEASRGWWAGAASGTLVDRGVGGLFGHSIAAPGGHGAAPSFGVHVGWPTAGRTSPRSAAGRVSAGSGRGAGARSAIATAGISPSPRPCRRSSGTGGPLSCRRLAICVSLHLRASNATASAVSAPARSAVASPATTWSCGRCRCSIRTSIRARVPSASPGALQAAAHQASWTG